MAELNNRIDFVYLFDVQDGNPNGDLANYTKSLIKKQPWGAALFMRVLNDGQAFTGQNI